MARAVVGTMDRIEAGQAYCALCGEAIRPGEDAFVTPGFVADEADEFWRFSDAPMHRACFIVWDRRKAFTGRFNAVARAHLVADDFAYPFLTGDGELTRRWAWPPGAGGDA